MPGKFCSTIDFKDIDKMTDVLSQLDLTFSDQKTNFKRTIQQSTENKEKRNDYHHSGEGKPKEGGARDRGNFQCNNGKGNSSSNAAGMRLRYLTGTAVIMLITCVRNRNSLNFMKVLKIS